MKTKSSLPVFGSDAGVAEYLASILDHCRHVTILFAGSMSILPYISASHVVAADLNLYAINYYKCLKGVKGEKIQKDLIDLCNLTLAHPHEIETARSLLANPDAGPLLHAWAYWAQCWLCRKGTGGTKSEDTAKMSLRRTAVGGSNASRLRSAISDLNEWANEFKRCEFECADFMATLAKVADKPKIGIYSDYVWLGAGDKYKHNAKNRDAERNVDSHEELRDGLAKFEQTSILVRYDDHPRVRELYSGDNWLITEGTSRTQANKLIGELWITRNVL